MNKSAPLRRLLQYAHGYRSRILLASLFSVLNKLFDLAPPILIGIAVDVVIDPGTSLLAKWGITDGMMQLVVLAGLTAVIWGLESLFEYLFATAWRNLAQDLQHDMRLDAYGHVQNLNLAYFEDQSTGGLAAFGN